MSSRHGITRRTALKLAGASLAGAALVGSASAHGGGVAGDPTDLGGGSVSSYVSYSRGKGQLEAMGVHFDGVQFDLLNPVPDGWPFPGVPEGVPYGEAYDLPLPRGNTGHFSYVGLDWNPAGHEPPGLYTNPHFDVHFYLPTVDEIASIPPVSPTYTIPDALMPYNTNTTEAWGLGPRAVVPGMGEHLITMPNPAMPNMANSLPQIPGADGWSVFIWGAYDLDGDGEGSVIFMEPMVTVQYLENLADGQEVRRPIGMPERFLDGGWYPTEFVVRREGDDYDIALESFEHFAGYDD